MKRRIVIWSSAGFLVAGCWALYAFATSPEQFITNIREPLMQGLLAISCPVGFAGRYFAISVWSTLAINAATYAVIGLIVEAPRRKLNHA